MILADYDLFAGANLRQLPAVSGGIHHPLHLRRLITEHMHDGRGRELKVMPYEIMGVQRLHQNGNLQVELVPFADGLRRVGYVNANDLWFVECYAPTGELLQTITAKDCPTIN